MIVVVADTSPLNYVVQIQCQDLLHVLYQEVLVPAAVWQEMTHPGAPNSVREWLRTRPDWIVVKEVRSPPDPSLTRLHSGEREAIQLAQEVHADLLIMDERQGVGLARRQGLEVTGTIGILIESAQQGLIDIDVALERLRATDFRCTPRLYEEAKQRAKGVA